MATNAQIAFNPQGNTVVVAADATANAEAAAAGSPAAGVSIVPGTVEILRFPIGSYFSGISDAATTLYITQGEGL